MTLSEVDPAVLDASAFARLERLGGEALVRRMVTVFLGFAPGRMAAAEAALAAGDLPAVAEAAHALKSSAGNVGGVRLHEAAREAEREAKAGEPAAVASRVEALRSALDAVVEALAKVEQDAGGEA